MDILDPQTLATPPQDLLKILILQRRNDALDSIEGYHKVLSAGSSPPPNIVYARVRVLFLDLEAGLRRHLKPEHFKELEKAVFSNNIDHCINAFRDINHYLDKINITTVDTKIKIDTTDVEAENDSKGL